MKYFEKNKLDGMPLDLLHNSLGEAHQCVSSNLFFHEAREEAGTERYRVILAKSAFVLIAVCEAIAERVPEGERERALAEIRKEMEPLPDDDALRELLDMLLGR